MNLSDDKIEIAIFTLVAILIAGLGFLFKAPLQTAIANVELIYEMPRPKSFFANLFGLGLEDREITRKYVNPFQKKKEDTKKPVDAKATTVAKSPSSLPKKSEVKKASPGDSKPRVDIAVVGDDRTSILNEDFSGWNYSRAAIIKQTERASSHSGDQSSKDNEMSGAQWRSLLSAQPTKENVAKLINAYLSKEADESTFFTVVGDLLRNNNSEIQALGLYAVAPFYETQSFIVVAGSYDQLANENQQKAQSYLMSYSSSTSHSGVLVGALKSNNPIVVELATQVVVKGYQNAKSLTGEVAGSGAGITGGAAGGAVTSDPRNARGDSGGSNSSVADYSKFVPIFQKLSQSSDPVIAGIANAALGQIESGVAAL